MSKKLINERAILLFPSLAKSIGLNNAIFLQQLHFWCDIANELGYGKLHEGERWVYKTAQEWHEKDFPFWSVVTIRRIINNLHDLGLIHAMHLNDDKWNRTLFYRINYLNESIASDQVDNMQVINMTTCKSSNRQHGSDQVDNLLTENTIEITSKNTIINNEEQFNKFWSTVPNKDGKAAARKSFDKALKNKSVDELIDAYKANIAYCDSSKRYYRNPSTWLNQEGWDDESIKPFMNTQVVSEQIVEQPVQQVVARSVKKSYL